MPIQLKDNLLAAWKLLTSFRKEDWELRDYPVVIRARNTASDLARTTPFKRFKPCRYVAYVVNWNLVGGGDTPQEAVDVLRLSFERAADDRRRKGKPLPRPGVKVPIEFAPREQVDAHGELVDDFVRRVPGLEWAWISNGSSLWDFHSDETKDELQAKIREIYGVDVSDIESGNIVQILDRIAAKPS